MNYMTIEESAQHLKAQQIINLHVNYQKTYGDTMDEETERGTMHLAAEAVEGEGMNILQ